MVSKSVLFFLIYLCLHTEISGLAPPSLTHCDVVVIGSGYGGLCAASLLAKTGRKVIVTESHYEIGGVAHHFLMDEKGQTFPSDRLPPEMDTSKLFKFEVGPSLYSGLSQANSPNPLRSVFQMLNDPEIEPKWITYNKWTGFFKECIDEGFSQSIGAEAFEETLKKYGGPTALQDWHKLSGALRPVGEAVMQLPSVALRSDLGVLRTLITKYPIPFIKTIANAKRITAPFSNELVDIQDSFLKNYLNLLCFLLQGLPAEGTLTATMAYMLADFFKPNAVVDYPVGGSGAIAESLAKSIRKNGGHILTRSHVEEILVEGGKAVGVRLRGAGGGGGGGGGEGSEIRATTAVISNADMWTTFNLIPRGKCDKFDQERDTLLGQTPFCKSFLHLHLGIDATGLDTSQFSPQWTVCNDWDQPIDSPGNVIVVSMPSLLDPHIAPAGHHVIHAYTAGNEPYELYEDYVSKRTSIEYNKLKQERVEMLYNAIEKVIPDVKQRAKITQIGTPLTHERFNRRYRGTYGPATFAGNGTLPGVTTSIKGLFRCGDSCSPGIGVPAVASSGANAAAAIMSVEEHLQLLKYVRLS